MPDDSRDEFLPENELGGSIYVRLRWQSPAVANSRAPSLISDVMRDHR